MKRLLIIGSIATFAFSSCKEDPKYVYGVDDVEVAQPGVKKPNVKTNTEYISIAYTDAFGKTISASELEVLETTYLSFGDKGLIEDLIVRNFLNESDLEIPSSIGTDKETFIVDAFKKIYNRLPNEFEIWYLKDLLDEDADITAELFYYALMTSNEYRQF